MSGNLASSKMRGSQKGFTLRTVLPGGTDESVLPLSVLLATHLLWRSVWWEDRDNPKYRRKQGLDMQIEHSKNKTRKCGLESNKYKSLGERHWHIVLHLTYISSWNSAVIMKQKPLPNGATVFSVKINAHSSAYPQHGEGGVFNAFAGASVSH